MNNERYTVHLTLRERLYEIIFEAETAAGKAFDLALLLAIVLSIGAVLLDSVPEINARYAGLLHTAEWAFTLLFTLEYTLRLYSVRNPIAYAVSFYGIVDLLAILPTYLSLILTGGQSLIVIRALRLLRAFRILKLVQFVGEATQLRRALMASSRKILVFLGAVLTLVLIIGAMMYLIEGGAHGFDSIPQAVYWAIVTLTTVGYGDVVPHTSVGKLLASLVMVLGYGIIAVPTGIVTVELTNASRMSVNTRACPSCGRGGHDLDANFCKYCGGEL